MEHRRVRIGHKFRAYKTNTACAELIDNNAVTHKDFLLLLNLHGNLFAAADGKFAPDRAVLPHIVKLGIFGHALC